MVHVIVEQASAAVPDHALILRYSPGEYMSFGRYSSREIVRVRLARIGREHLFPPLCSPADDALSDIASRRTNELLQSWNGQLLRILCK